MQISRWVNELDIRALTLVRTVYSLPFLPSLNFDSFFFSQRKSRTASSNGKEYRSNLNTSRRIYARSGEHLYEELLWCLHAHRLPDDLLQNGNIFMEEGMKKSQLVRTSPVAC